MEVEPPRPLVQELFLFYDEIMRKKIIEKIKKFLLSLFTLKDSAHNIAGGLALGIFWGILPGEGVGTTLVTATLLRLNLAAATIGILASNMWSTFVILPLAVLTGGALFGHTKNDLYAQFYQTYQLGWKYFLSKAILFDLALPLIVGYLLVSIAIALFFYLLIFLVLKYFRVEK